MLLLSPFSPRQFLLEISILENLTYLEVKSLVVDEREKKRWNYKLKYKKIVPRPLPSKIEKREKTCYLDLVVEIAQLLAQFGVSRFALVVEAGLAVLISAALVLPTATATAATATSASASCSVFASRKLRFHRRSDAALLDRPLRISPQFNQLLKRRKRGQSATLSVRIGIGGGKKGEEDEEDRGEK